VRHGKKKMPKDFRLTLALLVTDLVNSAIINIIVIFHINGSHAGNIAKITLQLRSIMLVHVKTRHIKIDIEGDIPSNLLTLLKKEYGKKVHVEKNDDEYVNVFETDWFKNIKSEMTPGNNMRIYRKNRGLTQEKLGELLGGIPKQHVSNMENGTRPISKNSAKLLAKIFKTSVEKFI
jgi:DNA-binding XRE family transcriptional regulator